MSWARLAVISDTTIWPPCASERSLDRDQQARTVLRELIRRFPEHALRRELDAALAAVGP